jgi:putative ABC transport system permease protein
MNILNKITLKSLQQNRTRTVVTIVGVILSVAMITAVTTFISSLQNYLIKNEIANYGDWHLRYENTSPQTLEEIKAHNDVDFAFAVETVGFGRFTGEHDYDLIFWVEGFSDEALENLPIRLQTGRLPQNYNEIVVPRHMQRDHWPDLDIGDSITLDMESGFIASYQDFVPNLSRTYTIVGIYSWNPYFYGNVIVTAMSENPAVNTVYIRLNNPRSVYDFDETAGLSTVQEHYQVHQKFNVTLLRALGISTGDMSEAMMLIIYSLGAILIALIMLGSISLIYNSFAISVSERTKQFGILSSVGATDKQLRKSVLFEGVFVGAIGIPLGMLAGIGGIGFALMVARDVLSGFMMTGEVRLALSVSVPALFIAALVGALTIYISAFIPARKAAKPSAIDIIRHSDDVKIDVKSMKTSRLTCFLFGLEGELAAKNFKRNKKRYRATVISLVISVVLFISASAFGVYLTMSHESVLRISDYDVAVFFNEDSTATVEEIIQLHNQIRDASYVTASNALFRMSLSAWADIDMFSQAWINDRYRWGEEEHPIPDEDEVFPQMVFLSDESYREFLHKNNLRENDFTGENSHFPAIAQLQQFNGRENRFETFDVFRDSSSVELMLYSLHERERTGNNIPITLTLVSDYPALSLSRRSGGTLIFAPYSALPRFDFLRTEGLAGVIAFLSDNPGETTAQIEEMIESLGVEHEHRLVNAFASEEENRRILFLFNFFIYGFIILISLITIANVFNTVSTSINLRKREFAMLRSTGMTDRGFNRMMNFECLFYGLKALMFGLPLSFAITCLIYIATISGMDAPFVLPWTGIGIAVFSLFLVVFVTMLYSVRKLKKANIIDALRSEIV